ncbi:MAG: hypothetical protein HON94_04695 [Methylococcales bacterium]|jgi:hypothetical protein|nr:hypothetical protein [Methylococcales bacterium]
MINLPAPLKHQQMTIAEKTQYELSLIPVITYGLKDIVPESLSFLRNRTTRALNKFLKINPVEITYESLGNVTTTFINHWKKEDLKMAKFHESANKEQVYAAVANVILKNQLPNMLKNNQIITREMRFLIGIRSDEYSPYRVSQRYIKPLKQRFDDISEKLKNFDCSDIEAEEECKILLHDLRKLIDKTPDIISESLEESAIAIDSLCFDFRQKFTQKPTNL